MQLLLPLLLVMTLYFVILPQRRRAQAQRTLSTSLAPGDRVVTAGGIIGEIVALDQDRALVEVAPGVEMEFLVQSVVRRLEATDGPESPAVPDVHEDPVDEPVAHPEESSPSTPPEES